MVGQSPAPLPSIFRNKVSSLSGASEEGWAIRRKWKGGEKKRPLSKRTHSGRASGMFSISSFGCTGSPARRATARRNTQTKWQLSFLLFGTPFPLRCMHIAVLVCRHTKHDPNRTGGVPLRWAGLGRSLWDKAGGVAGSSAAAGGLRTAISRLPDSGACTKRRAMIGRLISPVQCLIRCGCGCPCMCEHLGYY